MPMVAIVGYCYDGSARTMKYEYMAFLFHGPWNRA
jgi:hypothetical protein